MINIIIVKRFEDQAQRTFHDSDLLYETVAVCVRQFDE